MSEATKLQALVSARPIDPKDAEIARLRELVDFYWEQGKTSRAEMRSDRYGELLKVYHDNGPMRNSIEHCLRVIDQDYTLEKQKAMMNG